MTPKLDFRIAPLLREAGRLMTGLIYPPTCIACGAATGEPHALCARCWSGLRFIERPFCERLGTPFARDHGAPVRPRNTTMRPAVSCTASNTAIARTSRGLSGR